MSTFTVTITATGNVKGQPVAFSAEFDVESVYDVAVLNDNGPSFVIGMNLNGAPSMIQDSPSMVYLRNDASTLPASARLKGTGGAIGIFGLAPGQFVLLHEAAQGEGVMTINATATDVLDEVDEVYVRDFPGFHGTNPNNTVVTLFTAAS